MPATVIASLAMGCYRHGRREGRSLIAMHNDLTATINAQYGDMAFATGMLGRIDIDTGEMTWTNAGHPLPLLIRSGQVIGELQCEPTTPWGVGFGEPMMATEQLQPGDSLLLYTDGVTEARTPDGEPFGLERLIDLTERHASDLIKPEAIVRHVVASVRDHQRDDLADDATIVVLRWNRSGGDLGA
jgi:serine phosphatase RsbU (regulator of sigma subunit)